MQTFHENEAFAVLPYEDRGLLADLQHALGGLPRFLGIERRAPLRQAIAPAPAKDPMCKVLLPDQVSTSQRDQYRCYR
jgi:hypothetical protein